MSTCAVDLKLEKATGTASAAESWRVFGPALLVLAAAIPYIDSLRYGFVYDDHIQILVTPFVRSWTFVPKYFLMPSPVFVSRYYRPIFFLWLRLNYVLWNTHPSGWHFTSVLLHVAVCFLVLAVLRRYFKDARCALVGAFIFAVHPAHVETVAWISGCTDSLMAIGLLGALLLWMKNRQKPSYVLRVGSLVCCAGALLTKEISIILPILIWLHAYTDIPSARSERTRNRLSSSSREAAAYACLVAVYLAVRHLVLRSASGAPDWLSHTQAMLTAPSLLLFYVRRLMWPVAASLFYDLPVVSRGSDPWFWAPLMTVTIMAAAIYVWFRRSRNSRVILATSWFLLPIAPVLYINPFRGGDFAHDRYLYVPVLGLSVAIGLLCEFLWSSEEQGERAWLPTALVAVLIVSLTLSAVVQARPWRNNLSLYTNAVQIAPRNGMALNDLAGEYSTEGRYRDAAAAYGELLKSYPNWWMANYNYGHVNLKMGNFGLAEMYLRRAIRIDPEADVDQYIDLGISYFQEGRLQDAADELRQGIARKPDGFGYHLVLGLVLRDQGNLAAARQEILREINGHPDNQMARDALKKLDKDMASASR